MKLFILATLIAFTGLLMRGQNAPEPAPPAEPPAVESAPTPTDPAPIDPLNALTPPDPLAPPPGDVEFMEPDEAAAVAEATAVNAPPSQPPSDLPQTFDPGTVAPMIQNSPFTRAVSLSDSLVLTGLAYIKTKPVATILDKETHRSYVVSEEPNPQGWKLAEATATTDLNRAMAKIFIGGETVVIRYDKDAFTPEAIRRRRGSSSTSSSSSSSSSDSDRFKKSEMRGPSEDDKKRFEALSENAKSKFRDLIRERMMDDRFRGAPEEERRNAIRSAFERIEREDKERK